MLMLILNLTVFAISCESHPIYCRIKKLQPNIANARAMDISNMIYRYSKKAGMDPFVSVAIAMQESSFRNVHREGAVLDDHGNIVHGVSDIGIFQINVNTAEYFGIDPTRLMYDIEYQVESHFKILKRKVQVCRKLNRKGPHWSCYHSYTESKRRVYETLVRRYF